MGQTAKMFTAGLAFFVLTACNDDQKMDMIPETDDSFYAELLGGEMRVSDPDNPGQQVE